MESPLSTAGRFLATLLQQDFIALEAVLEPTVKFRALVPRKTVLAEEAEAVAGHFRTWFGDSTELECLEHREDLLVDRLLFDYRLRLFEKGESFLVEQKVCCSLENGRIAEMDLICSGFRPEPAQVREDTVHHFEADDLGCGSGLPREFRTRIDQIPVGHILEISTKDASAREDLPSMARLLGHTVHSVEPGVGEITIIRVERAK